MGGEVGVASAQAWAAFCQKHLDFRRLLKPLISRGGSLAGEPRIKGETGEWGAPSTPSEPPSPSSPGLGAKMGLACSGVVIVVGATAGLATAGCHGDGEGAGPRSYPRANAHAPERKGAGPLGGARQCAGAEMGKGRGLSAACAPVRRRTLDIGRSGLRAKLLHSTH